MAKNNKNMKKFINAMRAHGKVAMMGFGGNAGEVFAGQVNGGLSRPMPQVSLLPGPTGISPTQGAPGMAQGQGGLAGALTAQNPYQATMAPINNINYVPAIGAGLQQSLGAQPMQNENYNNQKALENQLLLQASGQGPNPAQSALNQSTGQNIAGQAALAAGQRGASSNVGLIQRQAAQQGAGIQQQAVGQGATLQAQQQLGAQQGAAALQGQIGNQLTNQQAAGNQLFGYANSAQNAQNANLLSNWANAQAINSAVSQNNANATDKTLGGILNGVGNVIGSYMPSGQENPSGGPDLSGLAAGAGQVGGNVLAGRSYAEGGEVTAPQAPMFAPAPTPMPPVTPAPFLPGGPLSFAGQFLNNSSINKSLSEPLMSNPAMTQNTLARPSQMPGHEPATGFIEGAGKILGTAASLLLSKGGPVDGETMAAKGQMVPGNAKVKGDSLKNDTVPAVLSPGEIVIPRSIAQGKNAPENAARFVAAILAKGNKSKGMSKKGK